MVQWMNFQASAEHLVTPRSITVSINYPTQSVSGTGRSEESPHQDPKEMQLGPDHASNSGSRSTGTSTAGTKERGTLLWQSPSS